MNDRTTTKTVHTAEQSLTVKQLLINIFTIDRQLHQHWQQH